MQTISKLVRFTVLPFALLLLCLSVVPAEAAGNYIVTIEKNGKLTSNEKLIFNEVDVVPGFSNEYEVKFVNQYKEDVQVYVEKVEVETTAPLTEHFRLSFDGGDTQISGGMDDFVRTSSTVLTVPANTTGKLGVGFELLDTAGNEYQNTKTLFSITFRIESEDSDVGGGVGGKGSTIVKTGDTSQPVLWLGMFLVSIVFLMLMLRKRKRHEEIKNA